MSAPETWLPPAGLVFFKLDEAEYFFTGKTGHVMKTGEASAEYQKLGGAERLWLTEAGEILED